MRFLGEGCPIRLRLLPSIFLDFLHQINYAHFCFISESVYLEGLAVEVGRPGIFSHLEGRPVAVAET